MPLSASSNEEWKIAAREKLAVTYITIAHSSCITIVASVWFLRFKMNGLGFEIHQIHRCPVRMSKTKGVHTQARLQIFIKCNVFA